MAEWSADIEVDAERASRWIATRFPDLAGLPLEPAGEGWDNLLFRVGPDLVFRFPRRKLGAELLEMELGVLPHLAAHLPLEIPVPLRFGEPGEDTPHPFAGYRWLDGTTADRADLSDADRAALAEPLGRFLGALHTCDPGPEAAAADPGDVLHRADTTGRLPRLLDRLQALEHPWLTPDRKEAVADRLQALSHTAPWTGAPVWVHGDLYPRHLVVRDGALVGVIDWGDSHRGDPGLDLGIAFTFLPPDSWPRFRKAHGSVDYAMWDRGRFRGLHYGINLLRYGLAIEDEPMVEVGLLALSQAT